MPARLTGRAAVVLLAAAVVAIPFVLSSHRYGAGDEMAVDPPVERAPAAMPAAIARPAWRPIVGDTLGEVSDFTWLGDTLVVLEARAQRVVLLRPEGATWRVLASWGRRGGGPGEFQRPAAIARVDRAHVAVLDGVGRIQRFTADGRLSGNERAAAPCLMFAPRIVYGDGARFLAGNCVPPGGGRDTIYTVLYTAAGDGEYRELARVPRMALDQSWGTPIATLQPLVEATDAIWFGTGVDACVARIERAPAATAGSAPRRCGLAGERFHVAEPPEVAELRRTARRRGQEQMARLSVWPEVMPVWFGLASDGDRLWLARPYSADSLVVVPADTTFDPAHALLVAPLHAFVACKRGACLWFDDERGLAVARPAELAAGRP